MMAIGDSPNDMAMLLASGMPVAVGNAEDEVKAIAEYIAPSNDEDGVADAVEKFVLNVETFFPSNRSDIEMLDAGCRNQLKEAGDSIKSFLDKHIENQYLLIVEGQASANSERMTMHNYNLSFQRALSLVRFWKEQGVNFGENVETQISGSGDGRWNYKAMREADEIKNQRFLIHIIPKNIFNDEASTD